MSGVVIIMMHDHYNPESLETGNFTISAGRLYGLSRSTCIPFCVEDTLLEISVKWRQSSVDSFSLFQFAIVTQTVVYSKVWPFSTITFFMGFSCKSPICIVHSSVFSSCLKCWLLHISSFFILQTFIWHELWFRSIMGTAVIKGKGRYHEKELLFFWILSENALMKRCQKIRQAPAPPTPPVIIIAVMMLVVTLLAMLC